MTELLKRAFDEASKLPKGDQDALAEWLLQESEAERRWDKALSDSAEELELLADEALAEEEKGQARPAGYLGSLKSRTTQRFRTTSSDLPDAIQRRA